MVEALGDFDGDPAAEKSADDGLAAGKEEVSPCELGEGICFEQAEEAGAEEGSDGCGGDDEPAMIVGEKVAGVVARAPIDGIADRRRRGLQRRGGAGGEE